MAAKLPPAQQTFLDTLAECLPSIKRRVPLGATGEAVWIIDAMEACASHMAFDVNRFKGFLETLHRKYAIRLAQGNTSMKFATNEPTLDPDIVRELLTPGAVACNLILSETPVFGIPYHLVILKSTWLDPIVTPDSVLDPRD